jgi:glutathione S-transferase
VPCFLVGNVGGGRIAGSHPKIAASGNGGGTAVPILVIGNKNYSSWSLRGWLAMALTKAPFEERLIPIYEDDWDDEIAAVSPTRKVPVLIDEGRTVWESLAIIEYLGERHPDAGLWPADVGARAVARAVSAEMHAGFAAVRTHMPMNLRKSLPGKGRGPGVEADVARLSSLWRECRDRFGDGGPFLFGAFSAADCMYAPLATRLDTYAVDLDATCRAYVDAILGWPDFVRWRAAALEEPWVIAEDEVD